MTVEITRLEAFNPSKLSGAIVALFGQARQAFDEDPRTARALVVQIVDLLDRQDLVPNEMVNGGLAVWQIKRLRCFITANLSEPIRGPELAESVRLSVGHFGRAFKISFGVTPRTYISRERMAMACELLRSTSTTLADIALECGLCDQAYFTRLFVRFIGVTPRQWRKHHRKMTEVETLDEFRRKNPG